MKKRLKGGTTLTIVLCLATFVLGKSLGEEQVYSGLLSGEISIQDTIEDGQVCQSVVSGLQPLKTKCKEIRR